jgi:hypothetical protein
MLSANGDHPMPKLSDTQLVILSAAAQRDDLSVLPLPDSLNVKGGALNKVMDSLRSRGLIRMLGGDGGPERVVITSGGMAAIGVEAEDGEAPATANTGATVAEGDSTAETPASPTQTDRAVTPAKGRAKGKAAEAMPVPSKPEAGGERTTRPTPRAGTKQAQMIEMLKRPEGFRLWALDAPIECKDLLKNRGYRWNNGSDGRPRAWYRDLDRELLVEEELFLAEKVYDGGDCRHQLIRIDYRNRFSDRV